MPLTRLDYQPTDYLGGVAEAGAGLAKTINDYSPADPRLANFLKRIYAGEDPRAVAIEAKFALGRHLQSPQQPAQASASPGGVEQMEPYPQPQQRRLVGRMEDVTGQKPGEAASMRGSMRSSMAPPPSSDSLGLPPMEETVTAPRSQPPMRSSQPLLSEPATGDSFYSQAQPPILNKDLPALMQGAGLVIKDRRGDLSELNYLLGRDRLAETTANRLGMQPGRDARTEATRATTANMPFLNSMRERNAQMRQRGLDISAANLGERQTEQYMKNAGPALEMSNALGQLLDEGRRIPGVQAPDEYARARRAAEIYEKMPILGQSIAEYVRNKASEQLTPAQREWQRRLTQSMAEYIHGKYGANLTGHELRLAQTIAGDQFGYEDTLAALTALKQSVESHAGLAGQAWPGAAQRIGRPQLPALSPPQQLPKSNRQRLSAKEYGAQTPEDVEMLRRTAPGVDWIDDVSDDVSNIGGP